MKLKLAVVGISTGAVMVVSGPFGPADEPRREDRTSDARHAISTMMPHSEGLTEPCMDAEAVKPADASRRGDFRLFGPAASAGPAAVLGDVTKTYWCPQGESIVMEFSSGAALMQQSAQVLEPSSMDEFVDRVVRQNPVYRKAVVRGGTAMTIEPGVVDQRAQTDDVHVEQIDPRGEYGAVSVVDDGTWITLRGNHVIPLRQLTAAVDELEPLAKRR